MILQLVKQYYNKIVILILCLFAISPYGLKTIQNCTGWILNKNSFIVKEVHITPVQHISISDLLNALQIKKNDFTNMSEIDVHLSALNIKRISNFIKDAYIVREFPDKLFIYILERSPIAIWKDNISDILIDEEGFPIEPFNKQVVIDNLPRITGNNASSQFAKIYATLKQESQLKLLNLIEHVEVKSNDNINILLKKKIKPFKFLNNLTIADNTKKLIEYLTPYV